MIFRPPSTRARRLAPPAGGLCVLAVLLSGCSWNPLAPESPEAPSGEIGSEILVSPDTPTVAFSQAERAGLATLPPAPSAGAENPRSADFWSRFRSGLALSPLALDGDSNGWLRDRPGRAIATLERARAYLPYILAEVEARGLPLEVALIPAIESGFRPDARSPIEAAGLWQFMPATGDGFGLSRTWWYDGRHDVVASTHAALNYLEALNRRFSGNWVLSVAAYNCGEGNVAQALRRADVAAEDAEFETIRPYLPPETQAYLPRLMAWIELVRDPASFGVELPALDDQIAFVSVGTGGQLDLGVASELAGLTIEELRQLNPGLRRWATDPDGPHQLLLPTRRAPRFVDRLAALPRTRRMPWSQHRVARGETLGAIGRRYGISVTELMRANRLRSTTIRAGAELRVPAGARSAEAESRLVYVVKAGDSLWRIAHRHGVSVAMLEAWNDLRPGDPLRPGMTLRIRV